MSSNEEDQASFNERARRMRVAEVSSVSAAHGVRLSGVTRAADRAELAFSICAQLVARPVVVLSGSGAAGRRDRLRNPLDAQVRPA